MEKFINVYREKSVVSACSDPMDSLGEALDDAVEYFEGKVLTYHYTVCLRDKEATVIDLSDRIRRIREHCSEEYSGPSDQMEQRSTYYAMQL